MGDLFRDWRTLNPDCAARNRPHGPHTLAGPGGNKPGAHCGGVPDPVAEAGDDQ